MNLINNKSKKLYDDSMKNALKICILLLMVSLMSASPVEAWSVTTHYDVVDATYYSLPSDVQSKLSLSIMRDGSDDPDLKFRDFSFHSYPESNLKAEYWLNEGRESYQVGDYDYASYCFGVASHYISDSFCAPHCESNSSHVFHGLYETKAMVLNPQVTYLNEDLNLMLYQGNLDGQETWQNWLNNEDRDYIQDNLNMVASASYTAIYDSVS